MEEDGIAYIELCPNSSDYDSYIEETGFREETKAEIEKRELLAKQYRESEKLRKKQMAVNKKINQIKSALSLKVKIEEPPVKTLTPNVYWVYKGCVIENRHGVGSRTFGKTGFVRYKNGSYGLVVKKEKDA